MIILGAPSKAALKQKKKREARKAKKAEEQLSAVSEPIVSLPASAAANDSGTEVDGDDEIIITTGGKKGGGRSYEQRSRTSANDPEKDKKIKNIIKKLEAIAKLKQEKAEGKSLDLNQNAKIAKENDLLKELGELNL